jgi:hypothetical protein
MNFTVLGYCHTPNLPMRYIVQIDRRCLLWAQTIDDFKLLPGGGDGGSSDHATVLLRQAIELPPQATFIRRLRSWGYGPRKLPMGSTRVPFAVTFEQLQHHQKTIAPPSKQVFDVVELFCPITCVREPVTGSSDDEDEAQDEAWYFWPTTAPAGELFKCLPSPCKLILHNVLEYQTEAVAQASA